MDILQGKKKHWLLQKGGHINEVTVRRRGRGWGGGVHCNFFSRLAGYLKDTLQYASIFRGPFKWGKALCRPFISLALSTEKSLAMLGFMSQNGLNAFWKLFLKCRWHKNFFSWFWLVAGYLQKTFRSFTVHLLKPGPPRQWKPIRRQNWNNRFQHFQIQPIKCLVQNNEISTCSLTGDVNATVSSSNW